MSFNRKRKNPHYEKEIYDTGEILPFKTDLWLHLQRQITSNDKSLPVVRDILSSLQSIRCRDICQGRLALDATYELYLAIHNLLSTDHNSVNGKEKLSRSLGVSINRVIGHLQEMEATLEDRSCKTIRSTLDYFEVDNYIATIRNEFAHGAIPNVIAMAEAVEKLLEVIVRIYWSVFDGNIKWPEVENDLERKIILYVRMILDMFKTARAQPLSHESFLRNKGVEALAPIINRNGEVFTKILFSTQCLIFIDSNCDEVKGCKYVPPTYQDISMRYIFDLVHDQWDVFEMTRTVAEMSVDDEEKEVIKIQCRYWTGWLIKKIVTNKVLTKWEVGELYKWAVILKLDGCVKKIKKNYGLDDIGLVDNLGNYPNAVENISGDSDIKILYTCGPWGC
uniref:HEPN_MAE_28990 domain-containing protein n=1 Tax=Strongyloides venezuelensis TaxID=75913 RepID=A0A0K0EY75_STRVS